MTSTAIADIATSSASVDARPIEGSLPNTAIFGGPNGLSKEPEPTVQLVASKDEGVRYECRFWGRCLEVTATNPGPLADGSYALEVRAVDAVGADETPAKRVFSVDTVAPSTVIAAGPDRVTTNNTPVFELRASETESAFECRLGGGEFAQCSARSTAAPRWPTASTASRPAPPTRPATPTRRPPCGRSASTRPRRRP